MLLFHMDEFYYYLWFSYDCCMTYHTSNWSERVLPCYRDLNVPTQISIVHWKWTACFLVGGAYIGFLLVVDPGWSKAVLLSR